MSLPKYRNPPVVEVALSVQFQRPEGLSVAHLGLAWDKFKTRFPKIEQHAPLPPAFERRGQPVARPKLQIQLSSMEEEMPRIWMVSDDSHQLLQFQADRFIRNWRRYHNDREPYPSWDGLIRAEFIKDYTEFCKFMNELGLGDLLVEQCEVTYVNHIQPNHVWQKHADIGKVFKVIVPELPRLPNAGEGACSARLRHELVDADGNFLGRLVIEMDAVFLISTSEPIFKFQLIARGQPNGKTLDDVLRFMDFGHETIVQSFTNMTTDDMHQVWERTQ